MIYDVIIIGSGPAGLTASIYTSRDNLKTLVLGGSKWGGQLMLTTEVENFPGFPNGILGPELMELFKKQTERFGTEVKLVNVIKVDFSQKPFKVWDTDGNLFEGKSVIVATGADTIWLSVPGEEKLIGRGVSSCAPCDAFFFKGKKVAVVGGGDSAMEEAAVLSKVATEVIIVHRRETFRASKIMQDRVLTLPNVKTVLNSQVMAILGENRVEGLKIKNLVDDTESGLAVDGVFVAIGHTPNTKIFAGQLELDEKGYIQKIQNDFQMSTSVSGVFVAGDVHDHHYKQAVTAAAYGCQAALEASRWLREN